MRRMGRKGKFTIGLTILVGIIVFIYIGNNSIVVNNIEYYNNKVPSEFDGYKILQISDLHNEEFGKNQSKLIKETKDINPDIIVITGDLIDSRKTDINTSMKYVEEAIRFAPIYYVNGNHEARVEEYKELEDRLTEAGVIILSDHSELIEKGESSINLLGINDPSFNPVDYIDDNDGSYAISEKLGSLVTDNSKEFKILLAHRPENIDIYANHNIDLVFSGHAHGGQIRLPFIGGLIAPNQGVLPKYTSGIYLEKNTSMVVSRGLGNSIFPIRIFNKPELVVVTLRK